MQDRILIKKRIETGAFNRGGEASSKLKDNLKKLGVEAAITRRVAIITYELEMNIIIHSLGGEIKASILPDSIIIEAVDDGPGIEDLEQALEPGFSTAGDEIREMGFGAGMGLNNIKQYSDKLDIETAVGCSTAVKAIINL